MPDVVVPQRQEQPSSWDFHAQWLLDFTKNGVINQKHLISSNSMCKNTLLIREAREKWPDFLKSTSAKIII